MRSHFRHFLCAGAFLSVSMEPAFAQDLTERIKFFGESRLRLEIAEQEGVESNAVGLTQLLRPGFEFEISSNLSVLVEGEALFAIVDDFDDGTGNEPDRPLIVDPNGLELNRAQLHYEFAPQSFITLGRQKISIDDQRFLGPVSFRQNDQTFDGVHLSSRLFGSATLQTGYFYRVNRVQGADNPIGRFRGDSYYVNGNFPTPLGRVGVFHYAFDLGTSELTAQDNVFSNQTTGVRVDGRYHKDGYGIDWEASYARQTDFAENPANYSANYWLVGGQAYAGPARLNVRFESLGAAEQQSFQTPLATLHRFQGAADVFLITPPEGLEDFSARGRWNFGRRGPFRGVSTALTYHRFTPEEGGATFGQEVDFDITAAVGRFALALTVAHYDANTFATDTTRFFVSLTHRF